MSEEAVPYQSQSDFVPGPWRYSVAVPPAGNMAAAGAAPSWLFAAEHREPGFPHADAGIRPTGPYVLVQEYRTPPMSKGGILFSEETQDFLQSVSCVGLVLELGAGCYKNADGTPWAEGPWCKPGDYVGLPKLSDEKWGFKTESGEKAVFRFVPHDAIRGVFTDMSLIPRFTKMVAP